MRKNRTHFEPLNASYIIPRSHHNVSKTDISVNALKVLNRLTSAGFEAYLVGGSVRDLLLGKAPKDFDIATSATPNEVRRLFRNARIIGRRFKLVHILFQRDIIEVATFRKEHQMSNEQHTNEKGMIVRDNTFGTLDDDAWRRDFTINSLYYNVNDASIIDFTGGVEDVQKRLIRMIGDPYQRYQEDPVRMLRAIRFSAKLSFDIETKTAKAIHELNHLISHVSASRLFDEIAKIYQCGEGLSAHDLLNDYQLFDKLLLVDKRYIESQEQHKSLIRIGLESTDARIKDGKPVNPAFLFALFLWFPLRGLQHHLQTNDSLAPLAALEQAMNIVIHDQNKLINIPKRHAQVMREIWLLQFRFTRRQGRRAFNLYEHPRFRAAYDFMVMRVLAGDADMDLAQWWTTFQDVPEDEQERMVASVQEPSAAKPKHRRRRPKTTT